MSNARISNKIERSNMTAEIARQWLEVREITYTPEEHGVPEVQTCKRLFWLKNTTRCAAGSFAGSIRPLDGYYSVVLLGYNYSGDRMVHLLEHGEWPVESVREPKAAVVREVRTAPVPLSAEARAELRAKLRKAAPARSPSGEDAPM